MSISAEVSRLETAKTRIKDHLVSLGIADGTETIDELAAMVETLGVCSESGSDPYVIYGEDNEIQHFSDITDLVPKTASVNENTLVTIGDKQIKAYDIKEINLNCKFSSIPDLFCYRFVNLSKLDGLDGITSIGHSFLSNCYSFNQDISIPEGVVSIGNFFMTACTHFNSELKLPSTLEGIKRGFLGSCNAFNKPLTLPNNIKYISDIEAANTDGFLSNCYSFNQSLSLPNSLQTIGPGFMFACRSFNKPITIPSSLTDVPGDYFMYGTDNFTDSITVNCAPPPLGGGLYYLSTLNQNAPLVVNGFTILGTRASDWINRLGNRLSVRPYRKIINA